MTPAARRHATGPKRSSEAHNAILQAAQDVLLDLGYQQTTMERIARSAGVSKQTLYRWWRSKADLYMEVYSHLAERHVKPKRFEDVRLDLKHLWKQLCRFYQRTAAGPALAGLLAEAQSDPIVAEEFRAEFLTSRREVMLSILREGVAAGQLREGCDLQAIVDAVAGAVWYRLLVGNAPLSPRFVDTLVDHTLDGVSA